MAQDGAVATATVCQHIGNEETTGAKTGGKGIKHLLRLNQKSLATGA